MKRTLIFAGIFALLAMIYVPGAMHTYREHVSRPGDPDASRISNVGGGYHFIFDQRDTSVAFFQLLVNVVFASGLGTLLAQVPKRFLIIGAAAILAYLGIASFVAMFENDKGNALLIQRKHAEAAEAYHLAAIWWRVALRPEQAREDDASCIRAAAPPPWEEFPRVKARVPAFDPNQPYEEIPAKSP